MFRYANAGREGNVTENAQTPMKGAVRDAINEQIKHEFYSAYLYLSMAGSFETANLPGFARWMRKQSEEEKAATEVVERLKLAGEDGAALLLVDKELGER